MCGIAGFINFEGHDQFAAKARLKRMTDIIAHRGPDAEGFYVDDQAALGHRRLSIIDLASGQQPMGTADGRYQIVFNGEIYNYLDIRAELEKKGHHFRTNSDTEVILYAYAQWGETCVERMNGMFAFVIWDCSDRKVFCARDRVGKKPLYLLATENGMAFASELKGLLAGGFAAGDIDPESLDCYFTFGYVPSDRSIFKNVRKLRPAHTITFKAGASFEIKYWSLKYDGPRITSMNAAIEEFEALLEDAVKIRLMSEVPLGAFLSGGIDSPLIASSMTKLIGQPVLTNSIGFDEHGYNELPLARSVAEAFKTDHREFIVRPNILEVIDKIAWHFDEPFADSSSVPTWYVCKMARENVTVALSGDGGDEAFGGYTFRYIPHMCESIIRQSLPLPFRKLIFGCISAVYPVNAKLPRILRLKTIFENMATTDAWAFCYDLSFLRPNMREKLYSNDFKASLKGFNPYKTVHQYYDSDGPPDPLSRSQFADINFYMTDDVLVKVDRMSMAHALEVRSPLLDYRILDFSTRISKEIKVKRGIGKVLLRNVLSKRLSNGIAGKPKQGFSIPAAEWLRNELRPVLEESFRGFPFNGEMLNDRYVQELWKGHLAGVRDNSAFLWALLSLKLWANKYL